MGTIIFKCGFNIIILLNESSYSNFESLRLQDVSLKLNISFIKLGFKLFTDLKILQLK